MLKNSNIQASKKLWKHVLPVIDKYMYHVLINKKFKADIRINAWITYI